jgi:hypothetical protein
LLAVLVCIGCNVKADKENVLMEYGDVIEYRPDSGEISVSTTGKIAFKDALAQVRMNVDTI